MNVIAKGTQRARDLGRRVPDSMLGPHLGRLQRVEAHLRDLAAQVVELWTTVQRNDELRAEEADHRTRLEQEIAEHRTRLELEVAEHRTRLEQEIADLRATVQTHGADQAELGRKVGDLRNDSRLTQAMLEERGSMGPAPAGGPGPDAPADAAAPTPSVRRFDHAAPSFDVLYRAFEDRYRGSREAITDRQSTDYLDLLAHLPRPDLAVVDLGCGRGELVRLLDEAGQPALGVDANHGQSLESGERLFVEGDLFSWLDQQGDESVRAVVAMHVVEHLPLDLQIRLVFEARRVLVPGGALILETPNAFSIITAATNFWLDPTHERPVHPLLLEFLADQAGFATTELRPMHPVEPPLRGDGASAELVADLSERLLGCGDIALVARR